MRPRPLNPRSLLCPGVLDLRLELRLLAITSPGTSLGMPAHGSASPGPRRWLLLARHSGARHAASLG